MRKLLFLLVSIILAVVAIQPAAVSAQGKSGKGENDRYRGTLSRGKAKGPKFCQNGAGHPVHGRQWCVDKGFGLGTARWDRAGWGDVVFGRQEPRRNLDLGRDVLRDVLGSIIFNRLDARRSLLGARTPLTGRWFDSEGRSVMVINAGNVPIAELVDRNRDRRVDLVLLNFGT